MRRSSKQRLGRVLYIGDTPSGPGEQRMILLRAIEVCSPDIPREGFDALLERQDVSNRLHNAVPVCQTNTFGFRARQVFKQLTDPFESDP